MTKTEIDRPQASPTQALIAPFLPLGSSRRFLLPKAAYRARVWGCLMGLTLGSWSGGWMGSAWAKGEDPLGGVELPPPVGNLGTDQKLQQPRDRQALIQGNSSLDSPGLDSSEGDRSAMDFPAREGDRSLKNSPALDSREGDRSATNSPALDSREGDRSVTNSLGLDSSEGDRSATNSPGLDPSEGDRSATNSPALDSNEGDRSVTNSLGLDSSEGDRSVTNSLGLDSSEGDRSAIFSATVTPATPPFIPDRPNPIPPGFAPPMAQKSTLVAETGGQPTQPPPDGLPAKPSPGIPAPESTLEAAIVDPELGILRLEEQEAQPVPVAIPPQPSYPRFSFALQGDLDYFHSSNILSSEDPLGEDLTQEGVSFTIVPQITPKTAIIAQVGSSWIQYGDLYGLDYRQLQAQVRVRRGFSDRAYGELAWKHQEYFEADGGDRFLKTNVFQGSLVHQRQILPRLTWHNFYQSQVSLADPSSRNQVVQRLGSGLRYDLGSSVAAGLNYSMEVAVFTHRDRVDFYNQATADVTWEFAPHQRLRAFSGLTFGDSSADSIHFSGWMMGINLEAGIRF